MARLFAMPDYVRAYVPGGSYFFMVVLLERRRCLLTNNIEALREAFGSVRARRPFRIDAIVNSPITSIAFGRSHRAIRIFQPAGA